MNTKQFLITVALLALAALASLPVWAGQTVRKANPTPLKMQLPPVYVRAVLEKYMASPPSWTNWTGSYKVRITVHNNTGAVIPKGTRIFWSVKPTSTSPQTFERKGAFTLEKPLSPNGLAATHEAEGVPLSYVVPAVAVKAWYVPVAMPPVS